MLSASGFRDGLGERDLLFDREQGEICERLFVRPELAAFESALRRRIGRLAAMEDPRLVPVDSVDHDRATGRLCVLSRHVSGTRLSDILRTARDRELVPDLTIGLFLAAEILTAAHAFHALSGLPHGVLTPNAVVLTSSNTVVLTDYSYAEVLEGVRFSPRRLWQEFGIAHWLGEPFSFPADVRQAGLIAIALMLGRPLDAQLPEGLQGLLAEVEEAAVIRGGRLFAEPVIGWLTRSLGAGSADGFLGADDAAEACLALLTERERADVRPSLAQFLEDLDTVSDGEEFVIQPPPLRAPAADAEPTPSEEVPPFDPVASAPTMPADFATPPALESPSAAEPEAAPPPARARMSLSESKPVSWLRAVFRSEPKRRAPEPVEDPEPVETPASLRPVEPTYEPESLRAESLPDAVPAETSPQTEAAAEREAEFEPEPVSRWSTLFARSAKKEEPEPVATPPAADSEEPVFTPLEELESAFAAARPASTEPESAPEPAVSREEIFASEPDPIFAPEPDPILASEPEPAAAPEHETFFASEPEPVVASEPEPFVAPQPEPVYAPEPDAVVASEPEPVFISEPEPVYSSGSEPAFTSEPEPAIASEPEPAFASAPEPWVAPPPERFVPTEQERWLTSEPAASSEPEAPTFAAPPPAAREPDAAYALHAEPMARPEPEPAIPPSSFYGRIDAPSSPESQLFNVRPPEPPPSLGGATTAWPPPPTPAFDVPLADSGIASTSPFGSAADYTSPADPRGQSVAPSPFAPLPPVPPPLPAAPDYGASPVVPVSAAPSPVEHAIAPSPAFTPRPPLVSPARAPRVESGIRLKDASATKARPSISDIDPERSDRSVYGEPGATRSGFALPQKLAAAAVVLLVAGLAAAKMDWTSLPSAASVPPGILVIETTPPGSEVFIDGEARGVTPTTVEVAPGRREIKLSRKDASHAWFVDVASGARRVERLDWRALYRTGGIEVVSNNAGSKVLVDGKVRGETPLVVTDLAPGRHTVVVQGPNGNVRRRVTVVAGETTKLDLSVYSGWVMVSAPIELQVVEDGKAVGMAGEGPLVLSAGMHTLDLVNRALGYRSTHIVDIAPGEEERLAVAPKGQLNANASPWAEVWLDGNRLGETPLANVTVPLGTLELIFKHPEHGERRVALTVTASEPAQASVDFLK